jgi:hypothetical protein
MNKKILEDVKFNNKDSLKLKTKVLLNGESTTEIHVKNNDSKSNTKDIPKFSDSNSTTSKYDFLNKLNKKTSSFPQRITQTPRMPRRSKPIGKFIIFLFIISIIIGIFYLISNVFFSAKVTVVPKNKIFELKSLKFFADKSKNIPFEVMIVDDIEKKDVILTNSSEVSIKAHGEVFLYNEYSTKVQKITQGSFISDEKGKTYKIDESVSIPGYIKDSTTIIPGEASVGVTAFLSGDIYNGNPSLFSINSYKGTKKYTKIYGHIKTPLTGGSSGLVYSLDDKEKELYLSNTSDFKAKLMRKLAAQVPPGYILYPEAVNFSYRFNGDSNSKTPDAKIEMKGTLSAVLLKEKELSSFIIGKLLPDISIKEKSEIIQPDLSLLSFKFTNSDQEITKDMDSFDYELNGNLPLKWSPDLISLKNSLVAKNKNTLTNIFKQDPGILTASVKIFPFWSKTMPDNNKNINIILK